MKGAPFAVLLILCAGTLFVRCGSPTTPPAVPTATLDAAVRQLVEGGTAFSGSDAAAQDAIAFYRSRDYAPAWTDAGGAPLADAGEALTLLRQAADDGLEPADYAYEELAGLAASREEPGRAIAARARVDVQLTVNILRYFRHLHLGRVDPRSLGFRLDVAAEEHDFAAVLRAGLTEHRLTAHTGALRPRLAEYDALRVSLARYRALAADSRLVPPAETARVRPGEVYADRGRLRAWLAALGDLPAQEVPASAEHSGPLDPVLVEAVRRFQVRHGLEAEGALGTRTFAALRVPLATRVRQIELALERIRWWPVEGDMRVVVINVPFFRLWAWDAGQLEGKPTFRTGVIVGRAAVTETPVLEAELREVVFRPYWDVPRSIILGEILPEVRRNPAYLREQDMEIVRGSGLGAVPMEQTDESLELLRQGRLRLRQRPGPLNALGLVKFVFPNAEDVYLHATPNPGLFRRSRRDFSHGCVRVERPLELAEWVLAGQGWTMDRIGAAMEGVQTVRVPVARGVRVLLFYSTAAVMLEDGRLHFADDIYGRDAMLGRALAAR